MSKKSLWLTTKSGLKIWGLLHNVEVLIQDSQKSHYFMPNLLLLFKCTNKIGRLCRLGKKCNKNSQLWDNCLVTKKQLIGDMSNIAAYFITYNGLNLLSWMLFSLSVVKKVGFICQKAKSNACWYFEVVKKSIDPTFYFRVIIQYISVKIAWLQDISF